MPILVVYPKSIQLDEKCQQNETTKRPSYVALRRPGNLGCDPKAGW